MEINNPKPREKAASNNKDTGRNMIEMRMGTPVISITSSKGIVARIVFTRPVPMAAIANEALGIYIRWSNPPPQIKLTMAAVVACEKKFQGNKPLKT